MGRKIAQWLSLLGSNAYLPGFLKGRIYKGELKSICVPGLNCYSCPGAVASCPLGALQAVLGSYRYRFSFYVTGLLLAFGLLFGRFVCGFLCPFGLLQELLHKIPFFRVKRLWKGLLYVKYVLLAAFVIGMPLWARGEMGLGDPAFCKYICPAGTLTAGIPLLATNPILQNSIGRLFALKLSIAFASVLGCLASYRFFCKALCPLGALYGFFNKIAVYQIRFEEKNCSRCGECFRACKMAVDPSRAPNHSECIRCGDCVKACRFSALSSGFAGDLLSRKQSAAKTP
ncbi:MAG: 4Fe-4S binding protein [Synergistaceae bacterium]|jgi:polyferredoxin|nr:4Fe-4S binding protein [Synergistaceae bacterium]